ncbi:hypothetical protein TDB9533_00550 [Thalassocella blandensis]|nr:hypothetical protein TDB9533_00550 [Thalassocella blandensis]
MKRVFNSKKGVGVYQSSPVVTRHNAKELHVGTNSLLVVFLLGITLAIAYSLNVFDPIYLKGLDHDLMFAGTFVSVILGVSCYEFWNIGKRSLYSFHFMLSRTLSREMIPLFFVRDYAFAIGHNTVYKQLELPAGLRKLGCISICLLITVITVDNRAFTKVKTLPEVLFESNTDFCPEQSKEELDTTIEPGCELVIRAFQLGYSQDLGSCAPKEIAPEKLSVCDKRRVDEPYFHYASRLLVSAGSKIAAVMSGSEIEKIEKKFALQWQQVENLRDYQLYAMSAAPRASHHIWTNLPAPNSDIHQAFIDVFQPNYCLDTFQNQTNTIKLDNEDERKKGQLLEHVYGQLLFNPKVKRTVGLCKEYQIHWDADREVCDQLAEAPVQVLAEYKVLPEIELVLKRHDIAQAITALDEKLAQLDMVDALGVSDNRVNEGATPASTLKGEENTGTLQKTLIDKSKIAKNKRFRSKEEIVSFSCFMQGQKTASREDMLTLHQDKFKVRTYEFKPSSTLGESQIAMYKNFARVMDREFHYTQLSSRSDLALPVSSAEEADSAAPSNTSTVDQKAYLQNSAYMLARLELLNNIDIFLGNDWVLEREDLLEVYPFHVHLQNYVESFRVEYQQDHGRL